MRRIAVLLALALGAPALAQATPPPADAPLAATAPSPSVTSAPAADVHLSGTERRADLGLHLGFAAGAGVLSVPLGLGLASWVGSLSNSLIWSALPTLLCMGLIAPTLTTLVAWLVGNHEAPGRYGFWGPWVASVVVNAAALVVAGFAQMSFGLPLQVFAFSVLEGALLGVTSVTTMRLTERSSAAVAVLPSFSPGISATTFVPLARSAF